MKNSERLLLISEQSASENLLTMSSREIADLVDARHDSVKRTIERLQDKGLIQLTPLVEVKNHLGQMVAEYPLFVIPVLAFASPEIEVNTDTKTGEDTVSINYPNSERWIKRLVLSPKINILFLTKKNKNREYLNCYEKFDFMVNKNSLIVGDTKFSSDGSRIYAEDILDEGNETLIRIMNEPKRYIEKFSLILTNKNLKTIANASEVSLRVCDELEDFTVEEVSAIKQAIIKRMEN